MSRSTSPVFLFLLAAVSADPAPAEGRSAPQSSFAALARSGESVVLLDERGESLYVQRGSTPPREFVRLVADASGRKLIACARWRSEWLGVDGSDKVRRLGHDGRPLGIIVAPVPVTDIAASASRIWVHGLVGSRDGTVLWYSEDGRSFQPGPPIPRAASSRVFSQIAENQAHLSVTPEGDAVLARLIGPPELYVVRPDRGVEVRSLAYRRSSLRDSLRTVGNDDRPYSELSTPVRDVVPRANGELCVLRNREDRLEPGGRLVEEKGLRVDRYAPDGSQMATAVLPETARWILRVDDRRVVALSPHGRLLQAAFGRPEPGGIVD